MTRDSIFTPVSKNFKIAAVIIAAITVLVSALSVFYYIPLRVKTVEMNKQANVLQQQKSSLQNKLQKMEEISLSNFFNANFSTQEIYGIANKYFTYEIKVNGKKIKRNNVKFSIESPELEILVTETYDFSVIPQAILLKASPFIPENKGALDPVSVTGTSGIPTIEVLKSVTRYTTKYNFKNIRIGEMFLVTINNQQISTKLDLGTNLIEISRVQ